MTEGEMTHGPRSSDDRGRARASALDLIHLGATLGADLLRGKRSDPAGAGSKWAHDVLQKRGGADLEIAVPGRAVEVIADRGHSDSILSDVQAYQSGNTKTSAMSFLAPGALTIATREQWRQLRPFNEHVLATGLAHPFAQTFLTHVRGAFGRPVANVKRSEEHTSELQSPYVISYAV